MEVKSNQLPMSPYFISSRVFEHGKRLSRKVKHPEKTPMQCKNSVVLKFQLLSGTPKPFLKIKTIGNYRCKARKRLFVPDNKNCSKQESNTLYNHSSETSATTDSAAESDEETETTTFISPNTKQKVLSTVKICASCKTRKTPLWRDAEDGTSYCNACGIRFKKYRIYCSLCSYIPRKDEKFGKTCFKCGSKLFYYNKI